MQRMTIGERQSAPKVIAYVARRWETQAPHQVDATLEYTLLEGGLFSKASLSADVLWNKDNLRG